MLKKVLKQWFPESSPWLLALIILGTVIWSLTMIKSGLIYSFGMGFWGPNGHDGVWHIALAESLARGSWQMPVFAGEAIKNYHIGFDLILAMLHKLTFIPISTLYFQIIPPILALGIGFAVYLFVLTWKKSTSQALWATFFVYFGGSLGWVITLLRERQIGGESLFWSQQGISTLINPPFALSLILILLGLTLLIKGTRIGDKKRLIAVTFIFGILVQIKVYAGILCLAALLVAGVARMGKKRKIDVIKVFAGALVVSILLFSPVTRGVEDTIILRPFWFLETMMSFSDRFYWPKFGEAMVNYRLGGVWFKGVIAYLSAFAVFLIGNFGTRAIGAFWFVNKMKNFRKAGYVDAFLITVIAAGIIVPMFYVQSGTAWNTLQFFYYSLMFSGILAGIVLGKFLEKLNIAMNRFIATSVLILLTVPTTVGALKHYLPSRPPAKISYEELDALNFLSGQPDGIVLTYPFDRRAAEEVAANPPRPLYLYESTAYVSAFSGKPTFLEDEVNLDITGYDWRDRREKVEKFLIEGSDTGGRFLKENNISYIYLVKNQEPKINWVTFNTEIIFENKEAKVLKVIN